MTKSLKIKSTLTANNFANIESFGTLNGAKEASCLAASFDINFSAGESRFEELLSIEWSGFCGFCLDFQNNFVNCCTVCGSVTLNTNMASYKMVVYTIQGSDTAKNAPKSQNCNSKIVFVRKNFFSRIPPKIT